ncbi:MAG: prolipoprotein diacylglyceryl transferase [Spirochaetia bacterium]|jgi:phosphatidylglycerol:prolipoprotein diacylglycerol transferase|nr:prolipoprotein diacylglyceryl transferase [Spirochaetia bacterium]
MYPIIFQYKALTIGGYGIMLGLAFYLAFLLTEREFKLRGINPELAYKLLLAVIPSAIIGAKLFHVIDYFDDFLQDPWGMLISGSGLTVYGGYIAAILASILVIKKNKQKILEILDMAAAPIALGYAIGRIGCHVAGDGCYGIVSGSFLGVSYPNGLAPTTETVYPTPLFESLVSFIIFALLMRLRKKELAHGSLFFLYILLNGTARFCVEFIRVNPAAAFNLTQAQIIAVFFFITGALGLFLVIKRGKIKEA